MAVLKNATGSHDAIEKVRIMEEPHRPILKKPKVSVATWVCPECGRDVEFQTMRVGALLFNNLQDFCPNCGQAIDWTEPPKEEC